MKITICSSAFFIKEVEKIKEKLEEKGYQVFIFPQKVELEGEILEVTQFYEMRKKDCFNEAYWRLKNKLMEEHIRKIERSDAILVLNQDKDGISGYIGGNTFLEMGLAYYLNKKIFLWKKPSEDLPFFEEIMALKPIIIDENLEKIR